MTLPTSKILKASKSIMAIADLKHNSPQQQQAQNVNVIVNAAPEKAVAYPKLDHELKTEPSNEEPKNENPYAGLPSPSPDIVNTRDIEEALKKTEEISESIEEKDNTIKALSLIIEIIQNNPLVINRYVVADLETLTELIRLITSSDSVEIDTDDIECSCSRPKYRIIRRIYIKKDEMIYGMSQCPVLLKLFDNYKISLNLVI